MISSYSLSNERKDDTPITYTLPRGDWVRLVTSLRDVEGFVRVNQNNPHPEGQSLRDLSNFRKFIERVLLAPPE